MSLVLMYHQESCSTLKLATVKTKREVSENVFHLKIHTTVRYNNKPFLICIHFLPIKPFSSGVKTDCLQVGINSLVISET